MLKYLIEVTLYRIHLFFTDSRKELDANRVSSTTHLTRRAHVDMICEARGFEIAWPSPIAPRAIVRSSE